jgi:hypothetical protein
MSGMKSWSTSAASNILANTGFTMDEGMAPSALNDSIRQLMADVRTEWAQGASIASAATVDLSTSTGGYVTITGNTGPITSFGTVSAGIRRKLLFSSNPTITHNATSLISPTGGNIVATAGDTCEVMSEGSGNWRILWYAGLTIQATTLNAATLNGTNAVLSGILSVGSSPPASGTVRLTSGATITVDAGGGLVITLVGDTTVNSIAHVTSVGTDVTSKGLLAKARSGAGVPSTSDIPSGDWAVWRDTSGATTKLYYNNAGSLMSVALA